MKVPAEPKRTYIPADAVPLSGIYLVKHYRHRFPHQATLLEGEAFPQCRFCGDRVRFRLVRGARRAEHDHDFALPIETLLAK
jgi:hypothetical protein